MWNVIFFITFTRSHLVVIFIPFSMWVIIVIANNRCISSTDSRRSSVVSTLVSTFLASVFEKVKETLLTDIFILRKLIAISTHYCMFLHLQCLNDAWQWWLHYHGSVITFDTTSINQTDSLWWLYLQSFLWLLRFLYFLLLSINDLVDFNTSYSHLPLRWETI